MKKEIKNGTPNDRKGKQQTILSSCMMLFLTSKNQTKQNVPISKAVDSKKVRTNIRSYKSCSNVLFVFFFPFTKFFLFNKFYDQHLFDSPFVFELFVVAISKKYHFQSMFIHIVIRLWNCFSSRIRRDEKRIKIREIETFVCSMFVFTLADRNALNENNFPLDLSVWQWLAFEPLVSIADIYYWLVYWPFIQYFFARKWIIRKA